MSKAIKIMHIINNLEVGGAEKMLVLLAKHMSKRQDVELYIVSLEGHGLLGADLPKNVRLKQFRYHLFWNRLINRINPNLRLGLYLYAKQIQPDVIHGHLIKGEDFAKNLGKLLNVPVITTSHDSLIVPSRRTKRLNRYIIKAVAVSDFVAEHLRNIYGLSSDKIQVIPNAIDGEQFSKGDKRYYQGHPVFLYIGRLLQSKGIDDAIEGLAKLREEYPKMEFLIYGKEVVASYKRHLEKLITDNNWDFVKFMGRTDDVPQALSKGDIFVLPSQSEGFAISVLEAAAAGKPIIATRTGAIPDMVIDHKSGIFVDRNSSEQIYQAAKEILDNNLVEQYGKQSSLIAHSSFDIIKVEQSYYDLYQEVLKRQPDSNQ